jgi:hypothetical protein
MGGQSQIGSAIFRRTLSETLNYENRDILASIYRIWKNITILYGQHNVSLPPLESLNVNQLHSLLLALRSGANGIMTDMARGHLDNFEKYLNDNNMLNNYSQEKAVEGVIGALQQFMIYTARQKNKLIDNIWELLNYHLDSRLIFNSLSTFSLGYTYGCPITGNRRDPKNDPFYAIARYFYSCIQKWVMSQYKIES